MSRTLLTLALTTLALTVGCNKPRPPVEGRMDPYSIPQVALASKELANDILVNPPVMSRDDAGILFVNLPVRSDVNKTIYIDYETTFFDRNGQELYKFGWKRKTLQSNVPDQITVNSLDARAADVRINLRYAR
jgi:hypothetical protein